MTDVLVEHERLETTERKAYALKIWVEPMVRWARRIRFNQTNDRGIWYREYCIVVLIENIEISGNITGKFVLQHKMASRCEKEETLDKMFQIMADRYKWRYHKDGFVRIVPTRRRYRDDAPMAFIEFIDREGEIYKARPQQVNDTWYEERDYKPIHKYRRELLLSSFSGNESGFHDIDNENEQEDDESNLEKLQ